MKKVVLIIMCCISLSLNAQLFEGGIEGGIVASQIDGDLKVGYHKLGVNLLGFAKMNVARTISLTSGVGYVTKGARSGAKEPFFNLSLHYAEVPFLININPTALKNLSFTAGVSYGYLIVARYNDGAFIHSAKDLNIRRNEFGSQLALNYHLSDNLMVRFSTNYSLLPITRPYSRTCWRSNILMALFYRKTPTYACWWDNNLRLTLRYKFSRKEE